MEGKKKITLEFTGPNFERSDSMQMTMLCYLPKKEDVLLLMVGAESIRLSAMQAQELLEWLYQHRDAIWELLNEKREDEKCRTPINRQE